MNFSKENFENNKYIELVKKYWIPIAAVLVAILVTISLFSIYKDEVLEIDSNEELENGKNIYLASGKIDTLNPIISVSEDTYYLSKLVYDSLFEYNEEFGLVQGLVSSYSVDTEKAQIVLKLKKNVKWHNGKSFIAKDVKFTIDAVKSYGKKGIYYEKVSKISKVTTKGSDEVTIVFSNKSDCALDNLVFPIVSSQTHSSVRNFLNDTKSFKPIGTGQYQYSAYNYIKELKLIPYKNYSGNTANKDIYVKILPDKSLTYKHLETYGVTCYATNEQNRKNVINDKNYKIYDLVSDDVEFVVFNTKKAPFNTKETRQAVAYGIDTKKVIKDGYMDDAVTSNNLYYPGFLGVTENLDLYNFNMNKASELLKEQGYEDRDSNGILENKDGKNVEITILVNKNNANRVASAKIISNNLKNIGFNVNVQSLSWDEYTKKIKENKFDILLAGYEMSPDYDLGSFFNGDNLWGYKNDNLLAKASKLEKLYTAEKYTELYSELKNEMLDELPYYTLCYRKMSLVGVEHFKADNIFNFDNIYKYCSTWSWKKVKNSSEENE